MHNKPLTVDLVNDAPIANPQTVAFPFCELFDIRGMTRNALKASRVYSIR
jgi:hypothetical protein